MTGFDRSPMWWRCGKMETTAKTWGMLHPLVVRFKTFIAICKYVLLCKKFAPLQGRARECRTWSVCRAEGSKWSVDFGREAPSTAGTFFQMHGCRNWTHKRDIHLRPSLHLCPIEDVYNYVSPENRQVRRLHQHLHEWVDHLGVEDNSVHHFAQLLVVSDTKTSFRDTSVSL